ncbi:crossover junction endodeoxyribonuclease RuvC [Dictyobacter alpinus]|uniref:Crossover junction endodeoxyribonuclease RuvC n=1 Tax=Dictyobacter alpinus TaxID=2014873 RepID=A0A402BKT3_9CHLR|nr:crossover junction endodeoxyribonuclease RuvC [Dictyobacter alpinus]GCE31977.1 crossover junction endodeoxyribonuclease RuvC [Dictyobacter alpinus]
MAHVISQRSPPERIILGVDPGIAITGYAFLHEQHGGLQMLACDVIRTPKHTPLPDRLQSLHDQLSALLATYRPSESAMEILFFGKNRKTAIDVAHARGVAMLTLKQAHLSIAEYTPSQIKLAVTGYGNADKSQVGEMVRVLLRLSAIPRPDDAADAAAAAICHAHTHAWRSQIERNHRV